MTVQLAATEYGTGPPVAILHGLLGTGRNWRSIAQQLAARHRVLAFDLRNHGASPWADGMSYGEMVEDLGASLRARGIDHAALLGHSMGGKVAMLAALSIPPRSGGWSSSISRRLPIRLPCSPICAQCGRLILMKSPGAARSMPGSPGRFPMTPSAFLLQNLIMDDGKPVGASISKRSSVSSPRY
jgi:pimeloyl-ACP methyl ester carboxylesterase